MAHKDKKPSFDTGDGRWVTRKDGRRVFLQNDIYPADKSNPKRIIVENDKQRAYDRRKEPISSTLREAIDESVKKQEIIHKLNQMYDKADVPEKGFDIIDGDYRLKDVTGEYIKDADPGNGTVSFEFGKRDGHDQAEEKDAYFLKNYFGGNVIILRERNRMKMQRKTADYAWDGYLVDRKKTSGGTLANRIKDGFRQITTPTAIEFKIEGRPKAVLISLEDSNYNKQRLSFRTICHCVVYGYDEALKKNGGLPLKKADVMIKRDDGSFYVIQVSKKK